MVSSVYRKVHKGIYDNCRILLQRQIKTKKVPSKAKVDSLYYQQNNLERIFKEEITALYGKEIDKFELHIVKVPSHASKTASYLAKKESGTRIKCIQSQECLVKSPDSFFSNGLMCFRFIKTSIRKRICKKTERTLENGSRGMG
ncbi:hypothetical protein TNCV_1956461 [Trichonephila clavipes]|nr:hypothetical protein TNCV_1956461 [Trichonephila clavipes]